MMYRKSAYLLALGLVLAFAGGVHAQLVQGKVLVEYWYGGGVNNDLDTLKADPDFPDNPDDVGLLDALDQPDRPLDYWGARLRAILTAPADGDYTFWTASDDDSELWLSTDTDPANATMICSVEGWTSYQDWAGASGAPGDNQQSDPVTLVAGQQYYVEYMFSDGTGGGFGSVAWAGPTIGDEPTVITGDHLAVEAALIPDSVYQAKNPDPADGAVDITAPLFKWEAGLDAVMHEVYFGTNPTPGPAEFRGPMPVALYFHVEPLVPGETYYWRIDEVRADGAKTEGVVWTVTVQPLEAHFPSPEDGATELPVATDLSWTAGQGAVAHTVYMSEDPLLVEARHATALLGTVAETHYHPVLEVVKTYYWAVDEEDAAGAIVPGPVWTFSTISTYIPITDGEVALDYDNSAEPYLSEVALDTPVDWTAYGMGTLTMQFIGAGPGEGDLEVDEATGTYMLTGSGADIWGNSDQFHYAYMDLNGDASIVARVVSIGPGSNTWAKGGVMIRQSLDAGSQHAFMPMTANSDGSAGNGASFQRRIEANGSSSNSDSGEVVAPPYYVRLDRVGNEFSGFISPDGETWTQLGDAVTIEMTDPVLVGLAVTSHQSGERRTVTFDSVGGTGDIGTTVAHCDVGIPSNSPQPLYLVAEDATGATAVITHSDPAGTNITQWWTWKIPYSDLDGVDLTNMAKLHLGVGDPVNPTPDGSGTVRFNDIRLVPATGGMEIIWVSDQYDDNADGVPDDLPWVELLRAQGYGVDYTAGAAMGDGYWRTLDEDKLDALNAADLVIVSRNSDSGNYNNGDEGTQWNSVEAPLILLTTYLDRNSRWKYLDDATTNNAVPMMLPMDPAHPIFAGAALDADGLINALDGRNATFPGTADAGNGRVLAVRADTGDIWIAEWDAGVEYYAGAGQTAGGARMFFAAGTQEVTPEIGRGEVNLTLDGEKVFLNAVKLMIPADVTAPGDNVKGVPDDGDWPAAETPPLAIDDNVNTKYLHFKGGSMATGFKVEPLAGPTIVTGLTFTTANDDYGRDPTSFELSGSNGSIDGPYEVISAGDIVDFAQEELWPRFTMNATPITFENATTYKFYQVLFTSTLRANNDGLMQIAEVELIGTICPTSYTYDGGRLDSQWDHDNGSDSWDGSAIGEGKPGGASALVEGDVTFLRIQDTGNPGDYGFGPDPSNRKIYLTRAICGGLDGAHLEVGIRVATGAPLDDQHPDDGSGIVPWPEGGIGYHIRDHGKGMFGICDGVQIISFSLAKAGEIEGVETDALVMNNLVGTEPSGDVDTGDSATAANVLPIADATAWNDIVIDIAAGGAGTHVVTVSVNGEAAAAFDVTSGDGPEEDYTYVTIGSSGTGGITAFDVDYLTVSN